MDRPFKCKTCGKGFPRPQSLKTHMLSHTGYKRYHCTLCPKKFTYGHEFKIHMNAHNGIRPYKCTLCSQSFLRNNELKSHLNSTAHNGIRSFKCTKCKKKFHQHAHLKAHLRSHTGDKPFKCRICSKTFTQSSHLNSHMLHHTGEKPHQCKICKSRYRLKTTLNSHMVTHTGDKPYKCPHCPKAFTQATPRAEHVQKYHANEQFPCRTCEKVFSTKHQVQRHEKSSHPQGPFKYVCVFCGVGGHVRYQIWNHIRVHVGERPYFCKYCDKSFLHNSDLKRCMVKHKRNGLRDKKKRCTRRIVKILVEEDEEEVEIPWSPAPPVLIKERNFGSVCNGVNEDDKLNGYSKGDAEDEENVNQDSGENYEDEEESPEISRDDDEASLSVADSPPSLDLEVNHGEEDEGGNEEKGEGTENETKGSGPWDCPYCNKVFHVKTQYNGHIGYHRKYRLGKRKRVNLPPKKSKNPNKRGDSLFVKVKVANPIPLPIKEEMEEDEEDVKVDLKPMPTVLKREVGDASGTTGPSSELVERRRLKSKLQRIIKTKEMKRFNNLFKCKKCKYSTKFTVSLELHIKLVHEGVQCHKCQFCWKSYPTRGKLIAHLTVAHENKKKEEEDEEESEKEEEDEEESEKEDEDEEESAKKEEREKEEEKGEQEEENNNDKTEIEEDGICKLNGILNGDCDSDDSLS